MEGSETIPPAQATPPAAPATAPLPDPAPVTPAAPAVTPPYEQGGNVTQESWIKSIDWLQVGLIFLGSLALLSVTQYHRLKIKNLKTDIPAAKKRIEELDMQIKELAETKVDKKQPGQKPNIGI